VVKLPADLVVVRLGGVRGGESRRLGGIRGGTERVRAHVGDACRLPGRSGGGHRCGVADLTGGAGGDEAAADLPGNAKLATREGASPGDRLTRAAVSRSFRLEQP
jgi:hypothetical protein